MIVGTLRSSGGGLILHFAVRTLRGVAVFQPVMNGRVSPDSNGINTFVTLLGVGGNLVAVQASRLSTALHRQGKPGEFSDITQYGATGQCPNPRLVFASNRKFRYFQERSCVSSFWYSGPGSSTTRVLLSMVIPGHLTFILIIWQLAMDEVELTWPFVLLYLIAALTQVPDPSMLTSLNSFIRFFLRLLFCSTLLNGSSLSFGDKIVIQTVSASLI